MYIDDFVLVKYMELAYYVRGAFSETAFEKLKSKVVGLNGVILFKKGNVNTHIKQESTKMKIIDLSNTQENSTHQKHMVIEYDDIDRYKKYIPELNETRDISHWYRITIYF